MTLRKNYRPRRPRGDADAPPLKFAKPRRQRSDSFIRFIHSKCCLICRAAQPEAHHLHTKGAGGSDLSCIPLCRGHHSEWHDSPRRFEEVYGINCWRENARLVVEYFTGVLT